MTMPLTVEGEDSSRARFRIEARTVILNRHGALVHVPRHLSMGGRVRVVNLVTRRGAFFRVVGPVSPLTEQGGQWGVEYEDMHDDIWGIHFPPATPGDAGNSKALLECRKCHAVALLRINLVEFEVLETSGLVLKNCPDCRVESPWGYAEEQLAMGTAPEDLGMPAETKPGPAAPAGPERRQSRRVPLQLPILVRDYYGGVEIAQTENISKGGFCFASAKTYFPGQGLMVACPYREDAQSQEVPARIVRQLEITETGRRLFGVRYVQGQ